MRQEGNLYETNAQIMADSFDDMFVVSSFAADDIGRAGTEIPCEDVRIRTYDLCKKDNL